VRRQLLSLLVAAACVGGCQMKKPATSAPPVPKVGPVEVGGFVEQWNAPLMAGHISRLVLREDMLFAYTASNHIYALSSTGGQILWGHQLGQAGDQILAPLVMDKGLSVIPGVSVIDRVEKNGNTLPPIEIGHSIRSSLAGAGNFVYCGLDYPTGGRLAKIDLTKPYNNTIWEFVIRSGISASPVLFQGIVFAAGEDGRVYAVNEQEQVIWPLTEGYFQTDGRIVADLKADNTGLYVASGDTKLYCLDITTGHLKWQYYASVPLADSPAVTADTVYQVVPLHGVVALDKTTGDVNRKPRWSVPFTNRFLAEDAGYVFLQGLDNSIIGVDKKTGEQKFHSQRRDLVAFASNPKGNLIYAATGDGHVLGIQAVTKPGTVGQVVKTDLEFVPVAMAR